MLSRRAFLASASLVAMAAHAPAIHAAGTAPRLRARPVPLSAVRLAPSPFLDAIVANRAYLLSLDPDRLLHNFYAGAGLPTKGAAYGGWEAQGIAGHSLGHYLSACALMHGQTGDGTMRDRIVHIVGALAAIQQAHGDGYIGGTTVERDGRVLDGKIIFEEVRRGDIRSGGFDLNGGWVPLYTWHKVQAGLIDAYRLAGVAQALPVLRAMADYLGTILEGLDEAQMQRLLVAEYGGLNEAYADTYALTGEERWLRLAERIRDNKVLDPLTEGRNNLPGLHANTQIPKLIGLARIYELTGEQRHADAARFFHETVVRRHSYVIGGNSDREHFGPPDVISPFITERACEACNSYNMLKLTRHLYGWQPDGALFDFYERVQLNHILAHQHPQTGMFVYFMPLSAGARRTYSTPEDSFWCCVGSGMESHAKHGDSIYWHDDATLYVNLFIPSALDWPEMGLRLETGFPFSDRVSLVVTRPPTRRRDIALRLPGWSPQPLLAVNGQPARLERRNNYALLRREWREGDRIELTLPMALKVEPTPDDPEIVAYMHGPLVLAADLGPAALEWKDLPPALVAADPATAVTPVNPSRHRFQLAAARPAPVPLVPFYQLYDRRSAVYFPSFTPERWAREEAAFTRAAQERAALAARTVDVIQLGEQQPEQDHRFATNRSDLRSWGGRSARALWWGAGNHIAFDLTARPGPLALSALYWGGDVKRHFTISIDGTLIATERRNVAPEDRFVTVEYAIPPELTAGKKKVRVRFDNHGPEMPIYEVRMVAGP